MKINPFIILLLAGLILSGYTASLFFSADDIEAVSGRRDVNQAQTPASDAAASISKSTILLLLALGVIGALGVNRKKKDTRSSLGRHAPDRAGLPPEANEDRKTDQP